MGWRLTPASGTARLRDGRLLADNGTMGISKGTLNHPPSSRARASREKARAVLEASAGGKWALIHGSDKVETFDSFDDAATRAVEEFGVGSYLIRTGGASTVTLPSSVVFQGA